MGCIVVPMRFKRCPTFHSHYPTLHAPLGLLPVPRRGTRYGGDCFLGNAEKRAADIRKLAIRREFLFFTTKYIPDNSQSLARSLARSQTLTPSLSKKGFAKEVLQIGELSFQMQISARCRNRCWGCWDSAPSAEIRNMRKKHNSFIALQDFLQTLFFSTPSPPPPPQISSYSLAGIALPPN